jgi:8-oxo-dGTP pyrophosphatase MutT (NUDIX family)
VRTERATSAGGIVLAEPSPDADVVLISRRSSTGAIQWTLPKGQPEPGERIEETAVREVREETGLRVRLLGPLDVIDYWFVWTPEQTRYHKYVHYFLMLSTGGDLDDHDDEVEEARWFPPAEAVATLSFANERRLLALVPDALATYARPGEADP